MITVEVLDTAGEVEVIIKHNFGRFFLPRSFPATLDGYVRAWLLAERLYNDYKRSGIEVSTPENYGALAEDSHG